MRDTAKKMSVRRASKSRNTEYSKSKFLECVSGGVTVFHGFMYTDMEQQQEASTETQYMVEPRGVLHRQNKHRNWNEHTEKSK
jgi:hypothetical protein